MCGIVGYIGNRDTLDFLISGLRRLEYRGYDSAGVAIIDDASQLIVTKTVGRIDNLSNKLGNDPANGKVGIGHTRWATHGPAVECNAHPHVGADEVVAIAHNGVIENYQILKDELLHTGVRFHSATDSEVIAHLVSGSLQKQSIDPQDPYAHLVAAVKEALSKLRGTYGLVLLFRDYPDVMIAAKLGSPLVIGVGEDEHFVASDASPLVGYTDKIIHLADHQLAVITADQLIVTHREQGEIQPHIQILKGDSSDIDLHGHDHYMMKEICEQPESLRNAMRGRLNEEDATAVFGGLNLTAQQLRSVNRIILTGCGTSWHSALVGEYLIEDLAHLPVEVEYASELRYRNPPVDSNTLLFALTQSGETADTLAALREMKRKGHRTLAICNVVGSSIAQEADGGIYLHAGPEIGVASTKAYTSQVVTLAMLALYFGRLRYLNFEAGLKIIHSLRKLPDYVQQTLELNASIKKLAEKYQAANNFLYLGRQYNFPTALEGALKLKEISYIHAEGYPAAEMKHGPIALIDDHTPSVFIMPKGFVYDKVMSNLEEVKARGGPVIAICEEGDDRVEKIADDVIRVPQVDEFLQPIISVVPLQLLSYHIALLRGCDVDKPRNLAKSVTVE